jgi:hypothetical protein
MDGSFENAKDRSAVLAGFTFALADNAAVYYQINAGKQEALGAPFERSDYFIQSLCLEWKMTNRFTYVMQYNLRNDNNRNPKELVSPEDHRHSAYGINNHFLYKLTDKLTAGTRVEWLRNNGAYFDEIGDYYQATLGLRWDATKHLSFRPEVRFSWCHGATPFAGGTRSDQVSGGGGLVVSF